MSDTKDLSAISSVLKTKIPAEALPYISQYHSKTVVIKYSGHAMIEDHLQQSFAHDAVLLKRVGINPVIIHSGGPLRLTKGSRKLKSRTYLYKACV